MDDGGIQEEPPSARFLTPTRSGGTRWVDGSEVDSSESAAFSLGDERSGETVSAEGSAAATGPASRVSSGTFRRRLGKRPRRVDSLDVEAMSVRGAHEHSSKVRPRIEILGSVSARAPLAAWGARIPT